MLWRVINPRLTNTIFWSDNTYRQRPSIISHHHRMHDCCSAFLLCKMSCNNRPPTPQLFGDIARTQVSRLGVDARPFANRTLAKSYDRHGRRKCRFCRSKNLSGCIHGVSRINTQPRTPGSARNTTAIHATIYSGLLAVINLTNASPNNWSRHASIWFRPGITT